MVDVVLDPKTFTFKSVAEEVQREEAIKKTFKINTISGGGGSSTPQKEEEPQQSTGPTSEELAEQRRQKIATESAVKKAEALRQSQERIRQLKAIEQQKERTSEEKRLTKSLRVREEIKAEALSSGRGKTRLQLQRELERRGTSRKELREATRRVRIETPKEQITPQVIESQTKPQRVSITGEVQPAPTRREKFRQEIRQKGKLTGTLDFLGSEASSLAFRGQTRAVKKFGGKFDPSFAELQGKAVRFGPLVGPQGVPIIIGEGVEGLTSKEGREQIKVRREVLEQKGLGSKSSLALAVSPEVAQISLGGVAKVSQIGRVKKIRDIEKARTGFVAVQEGKNVEVISATNIGKKEIFNIQKGVIKDRLLLTEGRRITPGQPKLSQLGKIKTPKAEVKDIRAVTLPKDIGTSRQVTKVKTQFGPLQIGRGEGRGVRASSIAQVRGEKVESGVIFGKSKRVSSKIPGGIEGKEAFIFRGGPASKLRITRKGEAKVLVEPKITGILVKQKAPSQKGFTPTGQQKITTKTLKEIGQQVGSLSRATQKFEISKITKLPKVKVAPLETPRVSTKQLSQRAVPTNIKQETRILERQDIRSRQLPKIITSPKLERGISRRTRAITTPKISQDIIRQTKQERIPKTTFKLTQQQRLRQRSITSPKIISRAKIPKVPKTPIIPSLIIPKSTPSRKSSGRFGVQVRRRGKFRSIGEGKTLGQAVQLGRTRVAGTLAATFKLSGKGPTPSKIPGFTTKKVGGETLFIEERGRRLSKKSEVFEIQSAKRRKRK